MRTLSLIAIALAVCSTDSARAVIPPNSGAVSVAQFPQLAGVVVEDFITPFSYQATSQFCDARDFPVCQPTVVREIFGTVQSQVVKAIDGSFDFYSRINVDAASRHGVRSFSVRNSLPGVYTAAYRTDSAGNSEPLFAGVNPDNGSASWGFVFIGGTSGGFPSLVPGASSFALLLDTDATAYAKTDSFSLSTDFSFDGNQGSGFVRGESVEYLTFGPAVPEPQTYALMLAGLGLVAWAARRRRR